MSTRDEHTRELVRQWMREVGAGPNHPRPSSYEGVVDAFVAVVEKARAYDANGATPPVTTSDEEAPQLDNNLESAQE